MLEDEVHCVINLHCRVVGSYYYCCYTKRGGHEGHFNLFAAFKLGTERGKKVAPTKVVTDWSKNAVGPQKKEPCYTNLFVKIPF